MKLKRIAALFFSLVLLIGLLPLNAAASELVFIPIMDDPWDQWTPGGGISSQADDGMLHLYDDNYMVNGVTYASLDTGAQEYEISFRARLNGFNDGPGSSPNDYTSFGLQLMLPTERAMFALEERRICASSSSATWGTTLPYPDGFDPAIWHEYALHVDTESDVIEISIDGEVIGKAAMQARSISDTGVKFYVRGRSGGNEAEAWIDSVSISAGEAEPFTDDFSSVKGAWTIADSGGTMPETILEQDALVISDASGTSAGMSHALDLSGRQQVSILFRARLDQLVASGDPNGATALGIQLTYGGQAFSLAFDKDGVLATDSSGSWGAPLTYPSGWDTLVYEDYRIDLDFSAGTANIYAGSTMLGTGYLYTSSSPDSGSIKVYTCGTGSGTAAAAVSNLRIGYFEESKLPSWAGGSAITVNDISTTGFTVSYPAADKAEGYIITLNGEAAATTSECSYVFENLPYTSEPYAVTVTAYNSDGNSENALSTSVKLTYDPDSNVMDIYQVVAGRNNGGNTQYSNYRIPGIVVTKQDTVIMYYESRMTGSDWADMDIQMFRSTDGGNTWGEPITLAEGSEIGKTMNNPIMIVGNDNTLHLLYCVEYGTCGICNASAGSSCPHGSGVFYRYSKDDGLTWSDTVNISDATSPDIRNVIATGPGHGICLEDGTLLTSVWLVLKEDGQALTSHHPGNVATLYSKDNGATWQLGEIVPNINNVKDPNETVAVQLEDGRVMLNIRSGGGGYRAIAISPNGYSDWEPMEYDTRLIDPTCFGSTVKYDVGDDPYTILMVNCESSSARENLVVKGSTDGGETWDIRKVIDPGTAGYSDIAVDSRGTIYVLYEVNAGTTCNLARLSYDCLTSDNLTKLGSLTVEGTNTPFVFDPNQTLYVLNAELGSQVDITATAYSAGAEITINGEPYTEGTTYSYTIDLSDAPLEITVTNGGVSKTYTLRLLPQAPAETMIMHLSGDSDFSDSTIYSNDAESDKVTIDHENSKFGGGSFAFNVDAGDTVMQVSPTNGMTLATDDFTVAGWVYPKELSGQQILFWYGGNQAGIPQWWCRINESRLQFNVGSDGSETTISTAYDILKPNEWTHVAVVRQGVNQYIYVNGQKAAEEASNFVRNVNGPDILTVGRSRGNDARVINGNMDEVMIFNYALDEEALSTLIANNGLPSASRDITRFVINGIPGVIEADTITLTLPAGTYLTKLSPEIFVSEGASVSPASGVEQDFTSPVTYTVTAENGKTKTYTVTVRTETEPTVNYTVSVESAPNGQVTVSGRSLPAGSSVTVEAVPYSGYQLDSLSVVDSNGASVPVSPLGDGSYSFIMPESDVTVKASFVLKESRPDVPSAPRYTINVEETSNGTVDVSSIRNTAGSLVTVTLTPENGYIASGITVTTSSGDELRVTDEGNGVYTFRMPNASVTVEAFFTRATDVDVPFIDVARSDWFYDAVQYVYANGLMAGTGDMAFSPNESLTRAMLVTVLWRADGEKHVDHDLSFEDVESGSWYEEAVRWAASEGIVSGVDGTHFDPDSPITREQLAAILYRYGGSDGRASLEAFPDASSVSSWAAESTSWAVAEGLLTGMDDGSLNPLGTATRAQVATILMRFLEK